MVQGWAPFPENFGLKKLFHRSPAMNHKVLSYELELCEHWGARAHMGTRYWFVAIHLQQQPHFPYFPGLVCSRHCTFTMWCHSNPAKLMSLSHFTDEEIETQIVDDKAEFQTQRLSNFLSLFTKCHFSWARTKPHSLVTKIGLGKMRVGSLIFELQGSKLVSEQHWERQKLHGTKYCGKEKNLREEDDCPSHY